LELSVQNLTIFLGTAFLLGGAIYRYVIKRRQLSVGNGLTLIVLSYAAAAGIIYMIGGIDFVFLNSSLLGFTSKDLKVVVIIGSVAGIFVAYYFFQDFLRRGSGNGGN